MHVAVQEPISHRVWILGGTPRDREKKDAGIRELTFSSDQPLKLLALESVSKNLDKLAPEIKTLPEVLRLAVKAKAERRYIIT